jgi:WD40 repeat protein
VDEASRTVEVLADAYQFARHNSYIADIAPLQLYASALVFAPDSSIIKTRFKSCMPSWLLSPPKVKGTWPSDMLKFEGHTSDVMAIAFSPDDKLLGTCSLDGTARIWNMTDANCFLTISHEKPNYYPDAVAFSSDSSKVAVAHINFQKSSTIKVVVTLYNVKTRTLLRTMQCSGLLSYNMCLAVAFDADDNDAIIAVIAERDQVQVWRVNDSNIFMRAWTSHFPYQKRGNPIAVGISQDASLLCCSGILDKSGRGRSSIRVLDPKTGDVTSRHDPNEDVRGMNISGTDPVYQTRQEGREPGTVCWSLKSIDVEKPDESTQLLQYDELWRRFSLAHAKDRVAFNPIENHTVHVEAIPESKRIMRRKQGSHRRQVAVAPRGDLVAYWHHGLLTVLDAQGFAIKELAVAPRGDLVDYRHHGLLAVFDPQGFARKEMLDVDENERTESPRCSAISPDCRYIALGHSRGVTVWDVETGTCSQYKEIIGPQALVFHDNGLMACMEQDYIRVLHPRTKRMISRTFLGKSRRLEFSADGEELIMEDCRVKIATNVRTESESTSPSSFNKDVSFHKYFRTNEWVQFDDEDLLWIPDEYRADSSDARGGTVALGQKDGSVLIMRISDPSVTDSVARV